MAYVMGHFPDPRDLHELAEILRRELLAIQEAAGNQDIFNPPVLHRAPDKTVAGMVVYADGSDWNPGLGEGLYRRDKTNTSWVPLLDNSNVAARPFFFAHKNGTNQSSITSATPVKITFGTASANVGGYYDTSTSRFTPPAGSYRISATLFYHATNGVDGEYIQVKFYKNGSELLEAVDRRSGTSDQGVTLTTNIVANGTDYYEVYAYKGGAGDGQIQGGAVLTYFCGEAI